MGKTFKDYITVTDGYQFRNKYFANSGKYILLTLANYNSNGGFKNNTYDCIYYDGYFPEKYILSKNDLLIAMTHERLLGSPILIPESNKYLHRRMMGLIHCNEKLDKVYAYYLFNTRYVREQLIKIANGTIVKNLTVSLIYQTKVNIPDSIDYQKKVAQTLWNLDQKIELNQKINDNLEQYIKLIYNQYFHNFEFPDENGEPYKSSNGEFVYSNIVRRSIPKDWQVSPLLDCITWESNSQPPKSTFIYEPREGYIRFIQNRDFNSDTHITYIKKTTNIKTVNKLDILMDRYGDAGKVRYGLEGAINVALGKITPKLSNMQEYLRSFFEDSGVYNYLHNSCMASTRTSLNQSNLENLYVLIPSERVLVDYQNQIHAIRLQILKNQDEIMNLTKLRNWLLPMLMNGQATID